MFRAPAMLMPHESTVAHDKAHAELFGSLPGGVNFTTPTAGASPVNPHPGVPNLVPTVASTPVKPRLTKRADSQVPNLFANPPAVENQTHELDDDADEEDHSSSSN